MTRATFTLGGRSFTYVEETTVEHDEFIQARLRPAGLHEATMQIGEDADAFARRLMLQSAESGVRRELLASLILPAEAEEWTPAIANETAAFLGKLSSEDDKHKLDTLFSSMLFRFFADGITSCYAYVRSLDKAPEKKEGDPAPDHPIGVMEGRVTSRVDAGESGPTSFASLLGTTTGAPDS